MNFAPIEKALLASTSPAVICHVVPDGDCLGSAVGLALGLVALGKTPTVITPDPVPAAYRFLDKLFPMQTPSRGWSPDQAVILVDCTDPSRTGDILSSQVRTGHPLINIDHHISNTHFGDLCWIDTSAAATGEIIYRFLTRLRVHITAAIATALYTAVVTDTGSFQYENTSPTTLEVAADLLRSGVELQVIRTNLWESRPLSELLLTRDALHTLTLTANDRVAWLALDRNAFERAGATGDQAEGLINQIRSLAGVEIAILFRELPDGMVKVGLRSKERVDVNRLASMFGGGGHRRAAGCVVNGPLHSAVAQVTKEAEGMLQEVDGVWMDSSTC